MACIYNYKGHVFNSELEFDNFLIEKQKLEPKYGDMVFSMSSAQLHIHDILQGASKDSEKLRQKYKEFQKSKKTLYNEDGEEGIEAPPYIGVNRYLASLKINGNQLFPEFRDEEYWSRRFDDWKLGNFNDNEIETFGLDKNNLPKIFKKDDQERLMNQMKSKWEAQAKTGTAIHNIMQLMFTRKDDNSYNFDMTDDELIQYCKGNVEAENKKYLNDQVYVDAIRHGRKLLEQLHTKYGEDLTFYPEFTVSQDSCLSSNPATLLGIIDLIVVDNKGRAHILDYKTSIHPYVKFSGPKTIAYKYQMAVYRRMLEKYGISSYGSDLMVSPIQIKNFRVDNDRYLYDGLEDSVVVDTLNIAGDTKMWENIEEFMPEPFKVNVSTTDMLKEVNKHMSRWFPYYKSDREITKEYVAKRLTRLKLLTPNENGVYTFKKANSKEVITAKSESEFVDKVTKYMQQEPAHRVRYTSEIKNQIKVAMKEGIDSAKFPTPWQIPKDGDAEWLKDMITPYCDGQWEIIDNEALESQGLLMLQTKPIPNQDSLPPRVDIIRVSTSPLTANYREFAYEKNDPMRSRKGLTGFKETDLQAQSKPNQMMAEAVNGNIEMIESLLMLNQCNNMGNKIIGKIQVVNPNSATGITMSNEQLLYCWNQLNSLSDDPVAVDKFNNGEIKLASKFAIVKESVDHLLAAAEEHDWKDEYAKFYNFKSSKSVVDAAITDTKEQQLKALQKLLRDLENDTRLSSTLKKTYNNQSDLSRKEVALYNEIITAIAQLQGVDFKQQLQDHDKYLETISVMSQGVSGSQIDNPGNQSSETLNLVTKMTTQAYQNVRDEMQKEKNKVQRLIENLKKEKGFSTLAEYTIGNQVDLYKNMIEIAPNGDLLFKNPDTLSGAEKEFLEYTLEKINKNRFPNENLDHMRQNNDVRYYQVPLAVGSGDSQVSVNGLTKLFKDKFHYLMHPKEAYRRSQERLEGIFDSLYKQDEEARFHSSEILYRMTNMFDTSQDPEKRIDLINQKGEGYFEHNLETLLMKHMYAYSVQQNMDAVFPMIKAAMIHINMQGAMQNVSFSSDAGYIENYIKNKIKNESIVDPKYRGAYQVVNNIKNAASKLTLAFSPVQALYQPLQGLWNELSLIIRKPDGTNAFTFKHFKEANKVVYSDLFHFGDKPTLCSALNELFGMNDMDMNTYAQRITSAKKGIWSADRLAMCFSSRPDYYNRMAIFLSQMMGDGCYNAVSIDEDGKLIYDWTKDERYSAFANNDKSDMAKYNKAKAAYYAAAQQFIKEGTTNPDGTPFELNMNDPKPLPRVYTNLQAESHKSLADDIYGYYSHEKKSMIQSTFLGALWLQFKTFWSGKKNQYAGSPGIKVRGNWEQLEVDGKPQFYQVDGDGNVLYDQPPTDKDTGVPFVQWKGRWQEGIAVTIGTLVNSARANGIKQGWEQVWNNDDSNLRTVYRSNIKQLGYDLMMWFLMGNIVAGLLVDWLDDKKKENKKNRDFATGCALAAANVAIMSVKSSFLDYNIVDSLGSPVGQWTPFAFSWTTRQWKNWGKVITGDEDLWDAVVKTSSAAKFVKPALDSIKPDIFRTKQEGGTFGVE